MVHEQMKTKGAKRAILVVEKTLLGHAQLLLDAKAEVRSMTVRVISSDDHGRGRGAARAVSYQHRLLCHHSQRWERRDRRPNGIGDK